MEVKAEDMWARIQMLSIGAHLEDPPAISSLRVGPQRRGPQKGPQLQTVQYLLHRGRTAEVLWKTAVEERILFTHR